MEVLASFTFEVLSSLRGYRCKNRQSCLRLRAPWSVSHGAGLTNIVFCKPQMKVIELFAPSYRHGVYWMLPNQSILS